MQPSDHKDRLAAAFAPASAAAQADYRRLRRQFREAGMLDPRPGHYLMVLATQLTILGLILGLMIQVDSLPLRMLLAVGLAFLTGQVFFLAHDVAHNQAFAARRRSQLLSIGIWNGLLGFSSSWWQMRHNAHHRDPNRLGVDPDIELPLIFYDLRQARGAPAWRRRIARFQAWFILLRAIEGLAGSVAALRGILRRRGTTRASELAVFALHWALYAAFLVALGSVGHALIVFAVHQLLAGLYITSVNALNHKSMPCVERETQLDFLSHQLHTTQNLRSNRFVDLWCGGLNRQIEHHLFPRMPRPDLPRARDEVRGFCGRHGLPYHETSLGRAYLDLASDLARVGRLVSSPAAAGATDARSGARSDARPRNGLGAVNWRRGRSPSPGTS